MALMNADENPRFFQFFVKSVIVLTIFLTAYGQSYPQYQGYNPNAQNQNYSSKSPFKIEVARLEASVFRPGVEPLPLSQVPRLNKGDILKITIAEESVNGIMPHQSNWDWTLMVAFINPSRNTASEETLTEEIRLRDKGWYKDNFFTVPYDSQPMVFIYPKRKYRDKILKLLQKKPDAIRQMGEKVIDISSGYAHISSFLNQVQYMMSRPDYYDNGTVAQSVEGMARSFSLQMPSCWNSYSGGYQRYGSYSNSDDLNGRMQCISQNIRIDDLNFSVGRMLQQGGLTALAQLKRNRPELSQWIAVAATAIDFFMKLTGKTAIKLIPVVVSTPDNPIYATGFYQGGQGNYGGYSGNANSYYSAGNYQNSSTTTANKSSNRADTKISLLANYQPSISEFVTVYVYVPHKWQAEADPGVANLRVPKMIEPCLHSGKNTLRNMDLRHQWLSDTFTRDFKLLLTDHNGWDKEFELRKNIGLNAWELDISSNDVKALPRNNVFDAKIVGRRGFTRIESPVFQMPISNGGVWKGVISAFSAKTNVVTIQRILGDPRCSKTVVYTPSVGKPVIFPFTKNNGFLSHSPDFSKIAFEVDAIPNEALAKVNIELYGGETINVELTSQVKMGIVP